MTRALGALVLVGFGLAGCADTGSYDLILQGGTIVDGSGDDAFVGDVGISGDSIAAIGNLRRASATTTLDVTGLVVAPGFINLHSHADLDGLPAAVNMLSQGVTTEILNADGRSPLDLGMQLDTADALGLALNVGGMIGFNSVWGSVVGVDDVRPTPDQITEMQGLVADGLRAGAWGVSAGLDYVPGYYATTDEVIRILEPFGEWENEESGARGDLPSPVFSNHDRVTPESGYSSIAGMTETLEIGEATGLVPLITHMKVQGWEQGRASTILERMAEVETSFEGGAAADVYPYLAGQTGLQALIIPGWAQAGGGEAMLERFADPELRRRIVEEANEAMDLRFGGPAGVYLLGSGRELTDVMDEWQLDDGGETVVRLLDESGGQGIIARFGLEADLVAIMRHPTASIACDCGASMSDRVHPRFWGSYPKVLGEYVREKQVISLEAAIHKMSGLPARTIGMHDRGLIRIGMAADLVAFDPATVVDHATYDDPTAISDGIVHTVVNGQLAWQDGATTGVQAGRPLRRPVRE
jgi:N-acyl-D-aspartate/D-glutamate deacylase